MEPSNSSSATTRAEMPASTESYLLALPGELRNRIYRLCLVTDDDVTINSAVFPEPALLATNKQIRQEALPVFYGENTFKIALRDYDSDALMVTFRKHEFISGSHLPFAMFVQYGGHANWRNLQQWLRRSHTAGSVQFPGRPDTLDPAWRQIRGMHYMVAKLQDLPWARVQLLVQDFRDTLIALDGAWAN